jgi:hypothetical protein
MALHQASAKGSPVKASCKVTIGHPACPIAPKTAVCEVHRQVANDLDRQSAGRTMSLDQHKQALRGMAFPRNTAFNGPAAIAGPYLLGISLRENVAASGIRDD